MTEQREAWLFTFGYGHQHPDRYVCIPGTFKSARAEMSRRYGVRWSMQYPDTPFERTKMAEHGITLIAEPTCSHCGAIMGDQITEYCAECESELCAEMRGEDYDAEEDDERFKLRTGNY